MEEYYFSRDQFIDDIRRAWEYQLVGDAVDLLDVLEGEQAQEQLSVGEKEEALVRLRWVAFAAIPENDEVWLITNHLRIPLYDQNFSLEQVFETKEAATPAPYWIDELVPRFIDALLKNEEKIGIREISQKSATGTFEANLRPTIGNWLKDYTRIYGLDKQDKLVVRQYMTSSLAVAALDLNDKLALERLLLLFESIKIFSVEQILREAERLQAEEEREKQAQPATIQPHAQPAFVRQPKPVPIPVPEEPKPAITPYSAQIPTKPSARPAIFKTDYTPAAPTKRPWRPAPVPRPEPPAEPPVRRNQGSFKRTLSNAASKTPDAPGTIFGGQKKMQTKKSLPSPKPTPPIKQRTTRQTVFTQTKSPISSSIPEFKPAKKSLFPQSPSTPIRKVDRTPITSAFTEPKPANKPASSFPLSYKEQSKEEKPLPPKNIFHPIEKAKGKDDDGYKSPAPYLGDLIGLKNIRAALQLNPKVANQAVSATPLEVLGQEKPLPPTVQHWILDYRMRFGVSGHTHEERDQFMTRSPNGKKLNEEERLRVAAIIESYDENTLLPISEKNGEIVFSEIRR